MDVKIFSDPRKPAYLNFDAGSKPLKDPIRPETLGRVRAYRHGRIKQKLIEHDCAALLVYDPLNIRYATDCSDMQIWTMHNPSRYALICAEGPTICFEYAQAMHLAEGLPMVDEVRPCISWFYFASGPNVEANAKKWADEIAGLVRQRRDLAVAGDRARGNAARDDRIGTCRRADRFDNRNVSISAAGGMRSVSMGRVILASYWLPAAFPRPRLRARCVNNESNRQLNLDPPRRVSRKHRSLDRQARRYAVAELKIFAHHLPFGYWSPESGHTQTRRRRKQSRPRLST